MKSVFDVIDNVQLRIKMSGVPCTYFNLKPKQSVVNIYFPEAFYSTYDAKNGVEEFVDYIKRVRNMVEMKIAW